MRINNPKTRKTLLNISNDTPKAVKELLALRDDAMTIRESFDAFKDTDKIFKLMKKKKAALSISSKDDTSFSVARSFNGEPLDIIKFRVHKMMCSADFETLSPELYVKYFCIFLNIESKNVENLLLDLLNQPSSKVNISAVRYAWVASQSGKVITLKFVRVLNNLAVEDIGPYFELEVEKEFHCGEEIRDKAYAVEKPKTQKNVTKNAFKDKIGRVYMEKQDLKNINVKKSRAYKKI